MLEITTPIPLSLILLSSHRGTRFHQCLPDLSQHVQIGPSSLPEVLPAGGASTLRSICPAREGGWRKCDWRIEVPPLSPGLLAVVAGLTRWGHVGNLVTDESS
jgi:hypothetical protein